MILTACGTLPVSIADLTFAGIPQDEAKKIAGGAYKSHCSASDFVKNNRGATTELTEHQQLRLFEKVCARYVKDSIQFYNKYKKQDSVLWSKLHKTLREVFVDMKYQGALSFEMVPVFGFNDKESVIALISKNIKLLADEPGRCGINYIRENMK
ncbi:hypothetical protein ABW286_14790 [Erwinia papayae]|uniref:Lipoprotein n=1 Tax=Erwinia papayae TaxID=206499 RepID=A0ABV3N3V0_9GAMM